MIKKIELDGSLYLVQFPKLRQVLLELIQRELLMFLQRELASRVSSIQRIYSFRTHAEMVECALGAIITRTCSFNRFLEKGRTLQHQQHQSLSSFMHFKLSFAWFSNLLIELLISRVCRGRLFKWMAVCICRIHQQKSKRSAFHLFVSINPCWVLSCSVLILSLN